MTLYLIKVNWYTSHRMYADRIFVGRDNVLRLQDIDGDDLMVFPKWRLIKTL